MGCEVGRQAVTYLDTNVVLFIHDGNAERISSVAFEVLEREDSILLVSGMVLLELEMLHEKKRIRYSATQIVSTVSLQIGLSVCQLPMAVVMQSAIGIKWTRDPGDRIIVANAAANNNAPLITSDRSIMTHYANTVW